MRRRTAAPRILGWVGHLATLAGLATLLACGAPGETPPPGAGPTLRDDAGRSFDLATPPARIISLVPSATEMIVALGAADRLMARTRYDQAPELAHLPSLGGGLDPNLEAVVALRPDLVVVTPDDDLRPTVGRLEALGIPVYSGRSGTIADLQRLAENLGALLGGDSRVRAAAFLDSLQVGFETLERRAEALPHPSVLYLVWHDPPMTAGPGSYLDDLVRAAGGRSTFGDQPTAWPTVSVEEILRRDPDWVVLAEGNPAAGQRLRWIRSAPGWRELRAVREGRVAVVEADLFNRPGPRVLEAARTLAGILHP